jgi:hypothetical protein
MKYILICIGDYTENQNETTHKIANEIMPMVTSRTVKYYNNDLNLIYHFESDTNFDDLKILVDEAISPYVGMYFLNMCTPNMSLGMSQQLYNHLFDLNDNEIIPDDVKEVSIFQKQTEADQEFIDCINEIRDQILYDMESIEDMEEADNDLAQIMKMSEKQSNGCCLDTILDKISSSGIMSLTKEEKKFLDEFSK